ncbi:MAG: hypothetical protein FJ194_00670 [Gammaproteobacteria bacterium]|nr:hypothetical protein [Gammaproteobacteria bacterium]
MMFALAAVVLWSTVATAFKIALAAFEPAQLLLLATVTSTLCFALISFLKGSWRLHRSLWLRAMLLGLLNPPALLPGVVRRLRSSASADRPTAQLHLGADAGDPVRALSQSAPRCACSDRIVGELHGGGADPAAGRLLKTTAI